MIFKETGCSRISNTEQLSLDLEVEREGRGAGKDEKSPLKMHFLPTGLFSDFITEVDIKICRCLVTSPPKTGYSQSDERKMGSICYDFPHSVKYTMSSPQISEAN